MDYRVALRGSTLVTASFLYFYCRPYWTHDTHMGNARCIVSADEKDQVARSCVGRRYRGGNIVKSLRPKPSCIADAALRQRPGYEAGAII